MVSVVSVLSTKFTYYESLRSSRVNILLNRDLHLSKSAPSFLGLTSKIGPFKGFSYVILCKPLSCLVAVLENIIIWGYILPEECPMVSPIFAIVRPFLLFLTSPNYSSLVQLSESENSMSSRLSSSSPCVPLPLWPSVDELIPLDWCSTL